jgi:hypothetical protein
MKKTMIALLAMAFTLAVVMPALAEDPAQEASQVQKDEMKVRRQEIVKLKYVRAEDIRQLIQPYLGNGGYALVTNNMPMVLSVSAYPENIEKILAAIRELDVKPADILYTVQLVLGSEADTATDADLQNDPIVKELRKLLRYKGYTLLDATLVRVINRERASVVLGPKAEFQFALLPDVAGDAKVPIIKTEVKLVQTVVKISQTFAKPDGTEVMGGTSTSHVTLIESALNIKSGERTVVGVSKLDGGDKGLILIISAKIVD